MQRIALLGVPSSAGARARGQEDGPRALRAAGLVARLAERGLEVVDHGDLPRVAFRPDPANPRCQNAPLVLAVARDIAARLAAMAEGGALPLVVGGDCTITLGVVSGLLARGSSLGLVYFDGDLDLNTPQTTPSGILDGMVTAHLLGRGEPRLARIGPRTPLIDEPRLAYFGYDENGVGVDPAELAALELSAALRVPKAAVEDEPLAAARQVLAALESRAERILVHFDLDVTDTPAVDVVHPGGLPLATAFAVVELLLASPRCAGLVLTEFNALLDEDGSLAGRLAGGLSQALAAARR